MSDPYIQSIDNDIRELGILIVVPTYNNAKTLEDVLLRILNISNSVLVINDGSTDGTAAILEKYEQRISIIHCNDNKGKGAALRAGFDFAVKNNFNYALSIDSDGQHFPEDIPFFVEKVKTFPASLIMGARGMKEGGAPGKSSFGNKFSNFWFYVETGLKLPDTQTGFRCYPIEGLEKIKLYTHKFELEVEVIVKLAWQEVAVHSIPIRVKYDFSERVSHFRPFMDFTRISILNTWLVLLTFLWYLPKRLLKKNIFKLMLQEVKRSDESPLRKSLSIGFGFFFGILPIWGFQLMTGIPFAIFTRLNKVLFIAAANISIPPFIPFIILGSYGVGELFLGESEIPLPPWSEITLANIHNNIVIYIWGAIFLAIMAGIIGTFLSLAVILWNRRNLS